MKRWRNRDRYANVESALHSLAAGLIAAGLIALVFGFLP